MPQNNNNLNMQEKKKRRVNRELKLILDLNVCGKQEHARILRAYVVFVECIGDKEKLSLKSSG